MNHTRKGFTLIELLVVVAIIGLIAAVVTMALGSAKKKGEDAAVQSNLHTIINQAEIFYADNSDSYLPATAAGVAFDVAECPTYNPLGVTMFAVDPTMAEAITGALSSGIGSACYNSSNKWAVAVGLKQTLGTSWCVDNSGAARQVNTNPLSAINAGICQ